DDREWLVADDDHVADVGLQVGRNGRSKDSLAFVPHLQEPAAKQLQVFPLEVACLPSLHHLRDDIVPLCPATIQQRQQAIADVLDSSNGGNLLCQAHVQVAR